MLVGEVGFGIGEKSELVPNFTPQVLLEKLLSMLAEEIESILALVAELVLTRAFSSVSELRVMV